MKRSESINELATALAKAQTDFSAAEREHTANVETKTGGKYSFNYADLAAYLAVCRKPLGSNGLSFIQEATVKGREVSVTTLLMHSSGQTIESEPFVLSMIGQGEKELITPQVIGSGITYARRYSLSSLIGMASEADDDGNAASGNNAQTGQRAAKPPCPKCGKSEFVLKDREGNGFFCWKNPEKQKHGCGYKWDPSESPALDSPAANGQTKPASMSDDDKRLAAWEERLDPSLDLDLGPDKLNGPIMKEFLELSGKDPIKDKVWTRMKKLAADYGYFFPHKGKAFVPKEPSPV